MVGDEEENLRQDLPQMIRVEVARQKRGGGSISHSMAASDYIRHCLRHKKIYLVLGIILIGLGATAVGLEAKILEKEDELEGSANKKISMRNAMETIIDLLDTADAKKLFKILKSARSKNRRTKKTPEADFNATDEHLDITADD